MKRVHIIQDVDEPTYIICFDSLKSLKNYLSRFNYEFKQLIDSRTYNIVSIGVIKDVPSEKGYMKREIYIKDIETTKY